MGISRFFLVLSTILMLGTLVGLVVVTPTAESNRIFLISLSASLYFLVLSLQHNVK